MLIFPCSCTVVILYIFNTCNVLFGLYILSSSSSDTMLVVSDVLTFVQSTLTDPTILQACP